MIFLLFQALGLEDGHLLRSFMKRIERDVSWWVENQMSQPLRPNVHKRDLVRAVWERQE